MSRVQKKGKKYEKIVGELLGGLCKRPHTPLWGGTLYVGQWIQFQDENGLGWAQPDFFVTTPLLTWLFECKLSFRPEAVDQLVKLYKPLLRHIFPDLPVIPIAICYNLGEGADGRIPPYWPSLETIEAEEPRLWYLWSFRARNL